MFAATVEIPQSQAKITIEEIFDALKESEKKKQGYGNDSRCSNGGTTDSARRSPGIALPAAYIVTSISASITGTRWSLASASTPSPLSRPLVALPMFSGKSFVRVQVSLCSQMKPLLVSH